MGGSDLIPTLIESTNESDEKVDRSDMKKHIDILEYLKKLPADAKVSLIVCSNQSCVLS